MRRKRRITRKRPVARRTRVMTVRAPSRRRRVSRARKMINVREIGMLALSAGVNETIANYLVNKTKETISFIPAEYHPAVVQAILYYAGRRFKVLKDFDTVAIVKLASEISSLVQNTFLKPKKETPLPAGEGSGFGSIPTASDVASLLQARNNVEMADRQYNLAGVGNVAEKYINADFQL